MGPGPDGMEGRYYTVSGSESFRELIMAWASQEQFSQRQRIAMGTAAKFVRSLGLRHGCVSRAAHWIDENPGPRSFDTTKAESSSYRTSNY